MFEFAWPWLFLLLPLPLVVYKLVSPVVREAPLTLPSLPDGLGAKQPGNIWRKVLMTLFWLLLVIAAARPVWYGDPVDINPEHRDLMLAIDLSLSMETEDMKGPTGSTDRLSAVKSVVSDFIKKREGDRLGLVVFGRHAYLQTPLTFDRYTVQQQLERTVAGMIGESTSIGEGLGIATKTFIDSDAPQRVIVLLSDGANTSGVLDPIEAAELARDSKVTIYTVGVGADEILQRSLFGTRRINPSRDLDEDALRKIADLTGGQYFRARNPEELEKIYQTINQLEPVSNAEQTWRPRDEMFRYPLSASLLLSVLIVLLRRRYG
ncbi:vWA domain-containing protein [Veronia pacifica]|uniref:IMP dehydrogenase n=1 Tax=Veronia pacifica TaxID=1080227 RepID=A0A1C3EQU6_9GAMM|nr:VWA domain-containing protein [Veronia pacifica]ODA35614.1 IMP dehydrogenase [Veronia pacifica]